VRHHLGEADDGVHRRGVAETRATRSSTLAVRTVSCFDYRTVGGVGLPFKITKDEGDTANTDDIRVEHVAFEHAATAEFERPHVPMDFTIAGNKAVVPTEFDGFVSVEAKLNGKGPFAFILDTAGRAILTHQVAQMLGLQRFGSGKMSGAVPVRALSSMPPSRA
jgi:hypothetical protein